MVDDLTGKKLGRASSGTFRTADVVGLDTMAHVIKTLQDNLTRDRPVLRQLRHAGGAADAARAGHLGQKTGAGFYKKVGQDILRFDPAKGDYVPGGGKADEIVGRMLKKPPAERLKLLRDSKNPQAQFLWAILRDSFHYAAVHLATIAESARDIDFAMRWGFGMQQGPFELWQAGRLDAGRRSGSRKTSTPARRSAKAPLPAWVFEGPVADAGGVHRAEGSWSAAARAASVAPSTLPVYERQLFRESGARRRRAGAARRRAPTCSRTTTSASGRSTARC